MVSPCVRPVRESDLATRRRGHERRVAERDVHATMLSTCVLVVAESEFAQNRPVRGPCPRQEAVRTSAQTNVALPTTAHLVARRVNMDRR